ncbi:hypothetical protein DSM104443_03165 [Usitatibacter rugosus]|uniref:Chaperone modulatory protein CbpM n=1 Tax=Usitatibacter rugosus TaxID=2732067 RepID=A0A6M4GYI2_9PROT|nr:MerR family transcriptional regulator [Usitatibacter rugosus]QJR12082.1 hypothetical protein DSM104443_03165 [Usitatibacter rugosus]
MSEHEIKTQFTLEELARLCAVEQEWVVHHVEEGLLIAAAGEPRFTVTTLVRARRIRQIERDYDAVPELAALVADLLEELDARRSHSR